MYFINWDEFQLQVEELYKNSPKTTRYVTKYRHCDGKLVLKVTDSVLCLKYRTDKLQDLNKFDRLNLSLMGLMQKKKVKSTVEAAIEAKKSKKNKK
jgi:signal recognition particle subunit SRP9